MAKHYQTAIVPARVRRPKDKPIVEGTVKLITRLFKWRYRDHSFASLAEINNALEGVVNDINNKIHSRFQISRRQLWAEEELCKLKPLPASFEYFETKVAKVHPDTHISIDKHFYSVPYQFVGKSVTVKFNSRYVKVFYGLNSIAIHNRASGRKGKRITDIKHLPENAKAYRSITPQSILSQARRINEQLHQLIQGMFQKDTIGNIRRAQGLISETRKEINVSGSISSEVIEMAINQMAELGQVRVLLYRELLSRFRKSYPYRHKKNKKISRNTNSMLRYQQTELNFTKENSNGEHVVH